MNTLEYINKATSKDAARFNLTSAYFGKRHLMATDGHRLHFKPHNHESVDKTYYLDPTMDQTVQYPDCDLVFKQIEETPSSRLDLGLDSSELSQLKNIASMWNKRIEVPAKVSVNKIVEENKDPKTVFSLKIVYKNLELLWSKAIIAECSPFSTTLNLRYLVEALDYMPNKNMGVSCQLSYFGELKPVLVRHYDDTSAIVMPLRA
jgi:hypothetical protein